MSGAIAPEALQQLLASSPLLLDVRTPDEHAAGTLAGAVNVPLDTVPVWCAALSRDRVIVCICTYGQRSSSAYATL